jgi:hypothetical protein
LQMTSWLHCPKKYFSSQFSAHITFASLFTKYSLDLRVFCCHFTISQSKKFVLNLPWIKSNFGATHQCTFFTLMASHSLAKLYKDGVTSYKHLGAFKVVVPQQEAWHPFVLCLDS